MNVGDGNFYLLMLERSNVNCTNAPIIALLKSILPQRHR
jgi:hypothetical protein